MNELQKLMKLIDMIEKGKGLALSSVLEETQKVKDENSKIIENIDEIVGYIKALNEKVDSIPLNEEIGKLADKLNKEISKLAENTEKTQNDKMSRAEKTLLGKIDKLAKELRDEMALIQPDVYFEETKELIEKEIDPKDLAPKLEPEIDIQKLKNYKEFDEAGITKGVLDKALTILDQRTSFLINKINNLNTSGGSSTFLDLTDTPSSFSGEALKVLQVNAGETALEFVALAGGGDALTANPLSQFAATTSAQLAGVISDETGSGALVFANSPTLTTPSIARIETVSQLTEIGGDNAGNIQMNLTNDNTGGSTTTTFMMKQGGSNRFQIQYARTNLDTFLDTFSASSDLVFRPNSTEVMRLTPTDVNLTQETASTILSLDASKNITSLSTSTYPSLTELSYVKGVTSAIQTQLNTKLESGDNISELTNDSGYTTNTGTVDTSGTPVANDFARFTDANTIEGRSYAEVRADLGLEIGTDVQAYDADLAGIAALTINANDLIVGDGANSFTTTTITTFGKSLIDDANASTARTTLGLAIGTDVQAFDALLDDIADLTDPGADRILFWDDSDSIMQWLSVGSNLKLTATTLDVRDYYLLNTGDVGTGVYDFGGATSFEIPNGAGGTTVDAAGEVTVDTTSGTLNFHDGTAERVLTPIQSKSITIESPTNAEDISMFYTDEAITITKIVAVLVGSSTPSVTWTLRHGTDRSGTGAEAVTSGTTTTSTTTGSVVTSFNDATVVADSFLWLETTAQSGTVDSINITVFYRQDA